MTKEPRPFLPQVAPSFDDGEAEALREYVLSGGWGTEFIKTEAFEGLLKDFTGAAHCIVTTSGTAALSLAMMASGLAPRDEVIVPDLTMVATPNAACLFGAEPVFVDIEPETLNIDIDAVERALTPRTGAVVHVSLNGRCNDLGRLKTLCEANGVLVIEDAAQSLGSYYGDQHLGTVGDVGCLSFSMPKVITTGQGGAVLTNDGDVAERVRKLKDFGRESGGNDIHDAMGFNFKFTDFQAVVGIEQMKKLPARLERKKAIWNRYRDRLAGISAIAWIETDTDMVAPWFIDIYVEDKEALQAHLKAAGIGSRPVYPPVHTQKIYGLSDLSFPVAEEFSRRGLWLPSSVSLTNGEVDRVADAVLGFYGS